jgi:hypothetical protein
MYQTRMCTKNSRCVGRTVTRWRAGDGQRTPSTSMQIVMHANDVTRCHLASRPNHPNRICQTEHIVLFTSHLQSDISSSHGELELRLR